jgi:hypothetical protein
MKICGAFTNARPEKIFHPKDINLPYSANSFFFVLIPGRFDKKKRVAILRKHDD